MDNSNIKEAILIGVPQSISDYVHTGIPILICPMWEPVGKVITGLQQLFNFYSFDASIAEDFSHGITYLVVSHDGVTSFGTAESVIDIIVLATCTSEVEIRKVESKS